MYQVSCAAPYFLEACITVFDRTLNTKSIFIDFNKVFDSINRSLVILSMGRYRFQRKPRAAQIVNSIIVCQLRL